MRTGTARGRSPAAWSPACRGRARQSDRRGGRGALCSASIASGARWCSAAPARTARAFGRRPCRSRSRPCCGRCARDARPAAPARRARARPDAPSDSAASTDTPAIGLFALGDDGVGHRRRRRRCGSRAARSADPAASRRIGDRLARLDDERRALGVDARADRRQPHAGGRRRARAGRIDERAGGGDGEKQGKAPRDESFLGVLERSQQFANLPLLHERQRIVDFLNDDESLRRDRLDRAVERTCRPGARCRSCCPGPEPSRPARRGSA